MFASIRRWWGKGPDQFAEQKAALKRLDALAPLKFTPDKSTTAASNEEDAFICREAVINRHQRIDGFEFSLMPRLQSRFREESVLARRVYDDAIMRNLARAGVASLMGDRYALITPLRKYDLHRESSGIPDVLAVEETLDHIGLPLATVQV